MAMTRVSVFIITWPSSSQSKKSCYNPNTKYKACFYSHSVFRPNKLIKHNCKKRKLGAMGRLRRWERRRQLGLHNRRIHNKYAYNSIIYTLLNSCLFSKGEIYINSI
jgi:hypothetical protein